MQNTRSLQQITLRNMTNVNVDVFSEAFRVENAAASGLLKLLLRSPARRSARIALEFERLVAEHDNLQHAAQWLLTLWTAETIVRHAGNIPASGPLLVVSNHPGLADAIALFASITRTDLRVVAKTRNLLDVLPNTNRHMLFVSDRSADRMAVLRQALAHLREGGALLTFPAGQIEPDPHHHPALAAASLDTWAQSIELFARRVPNLMVLPVAVGGVISTSALDNRLCRLYQKREVREYVAATLQIIFPAYQDVTVRVAYGEPMNPAGASLNRIQAQMRDLYAQVGQAEG